jgi:L-lactate dehydrogenase complex protein LldF
MLRCIRCGACMNHCPVYQTIGGHAYGWVYPGPMGSVLTPLYAGIENAIDLPARGHAVQPVRRRLPGEDSAARSLRKLREKQTDARAEAAR